ncbi:MAG TPA: RNA polymerase subunit sigma [Acidimicrobiaceae bacterium]|nr:RNA polymerase subunit sigma [Acidimicrobiaceae bacterium]
MGDRAGHDGDVDVLDPLRAYAEAAVEGDDVAVAALVRATQPAVWRLCTALGSVDTVDDLVQDTYLRALKALPGYRFETPVQVWLLSIARRVCADDIRRRQRRRRLIDRMQRYSDVSETTADSEGEAVSALLDSLAPDRREAFVLTQVLGLSYLEAADVMECPVGTVRSRVARARADLAGLVEQSLAL